MEPRTIPGTSILLPALGFGAAPIGNLYFPITDGEAVATVDAAWEAGIRYYDTAPHYGLGLSERRIGQALEGRPRSDYTLSTKVGRLLRPNPEPQGQDKGGFAVPDDLHRVRDYSRDGVLRSIEESLVRLRTDRIDIVYIHDPDDFWDEAINSAVPTLSALRDEGVIGAYGVGMNQTEMLHRFVTDSDINLVMLAGRYTLLEQGALSGLIPACHSRDVGIVNVGVFNSGLLSQGRPAPGTTYNYQPASPEVIDKANRLADICEEYGTSLPAAAIAFPYLNPAVFSVVLGMRTAEQVRQNLDLAARPVPSELWAALRAERLTQ